jgi:hypothetical protein
MQWFMDTLARHINKIFRIVFAVCGALFPYAYLWALFSFWNQLQWVVFVLLIGPFYWMHNFGKQETKRTAAIDLRWQKSLDHVNEEREILRQEICHLRKRLDK